MRVPLRGTCGSPSRFHHMVRYVGPGVYLHLGQQVKTKERLSFRRTRRRCWHELLPKKRCVEGLLASVSERVATSRRHASPDLSLSANYPTVGRGFPT